MVFERVRGLVTRSGASKLIRSAARRQGQPPSRNWAVGPDTYTSVAAGQPVKSWWKLGPFHAFDGARIVGAEAALKVPKGPILRGIRQRASQT